MNALGNDSKLMCMQLNQGDNDPQAFISSQPELQQAKYRPLANVLAPPSPSSGWRQMTRAAQMACQAAVALMRESGLSFFSFSQGCDIGMLQAFNPNIHGPKIRSLLMQKNHRFISPLFFTNFAPNSVSDHVSRLLGIHAFNYTITNGGTSSLETLGMAGQALQNGRAQGILAGGVQEASEEFVHGFAFGGKSGGAIQVWQAGAITVGEGCAWLFLEKEGAIKARQAKPRAWLLGYGMRFAPADAGSGTQAAVLAAVQQALQAAKSAPESIGSVFVAANGDGEQDLAEALALRKVFGNVLPPAVALKGALGETHFASGAMAVVAAILCLEAQCIPATQSLAQGKAAELLGLSSQARTVSARRALVLSVEHPGQAAAVVLEVA